MLFHWEGDDNRFDEDDNDGDEDFGSCDDDNDTDDDNDGGVVPLIAVAVDVEDVMGVGRMEKVLDVCFF